MIFAGLEMVGEIPFRHVIIHTTVLAADGRRMSKSLGTGLDPLDLVDEHGADATRYGLLKMTSSQDVRFAIGAIEEGRKLANKLWNASRLLLGAGAGRGRASSRGGRGTLDLRAARRRRCRGEADLDAFDFAHAVDRLYHVTFDDFCDWYPRRSSLGSTKATRTRVRRPSRRSSGCSSSFTP